MPEPNLLPLDSARWKSFGTLSGDPWQVPARLAAWRQSIGGPEEDRLWGELVEQFLHQGTTTEAAYAAVPYMVREFERLAPKQRLDHLADVAFIELDRQETGARRLAPDLADPYLAAINEARQVALQCLSLEWPKHEFLHLLGIIACLHGHGGLGDLLLDPSSLTAECPKCGEFVYPQNLRRSGYVIG